MAAVRRLRILFLATMVAVAITAVPAVAFATTTVTYGVSGLEYAATTTAGSFVIVVLVHEQSNPLRPIFC